MKKLIYGSLFLALVGIGVIGCKKETSVSHKDSSLNSLLSLKSSPLEIPIYTNWEEVFD